MEKLSQSTKEKIQEQTQPPKPSNPRAFPRPLGNYKEESTNTVIYSTAQDGMTLLDYFAGQALVGLYAASPELSLQDATRLAYDSAKLMLQERTKYIK